MMSTSDTHRLGQLGRAIAEKLLPTSSATLPHQLHSLQRFQGSNENEPLLLFTLHQEVQEPMHPVIQIDIGRSRRISVHEVPGTLSLPSMAGRITHCGICLRLDNPPAAYSQGDRAADHLPCAGNRIAPEELAVQGLQLHAQGI